MDTKRTWRVDAVRDGKWWVFEIPEIDAGGQAMSLAEIPDEAQGVVAMWLDVDPETVDVDVDVRGIDDARQAWSAGEAAEAAARRAQAEAAAQKRWAVVALTKEHGLSAADAGRVLGVSKQRVYQIVGTSRRRRGSEADG